jgi:hypothetical protein
MAVRFFSYWWNKPGNNTGQGFDEWWMVNKESFISTQPVIDFHTKIKVITDRIIKYDETFVPTSLHPILIGGIMRILEAELIGITSQIETPEPK